MDHLFHIVTQNRKILYQILKQTPIEKLVLIPEGHRNNIWWNIAHIVVTHELLVNKLSGRPMGVPTEIVDKYRKGTFPDGTPSAEEIEAVKEWLFSTVEAAEKDYKEGLYDEFTPYTTSTQVELKSVEDAMAFNVFHEGLHLGVILSLQKHQA